MDYTLEEALPVIYIEKNGNLYDLHWDSYECEASNILHENRDYIEGFLDGCYKVLSIEHKLPTRVWGHSTGFVAGITKHVAEILEQLIKDLLHNLVTERYKNLEKEEARKKLA
jgi:hypothetical protein